jgi:hypothetical protein
MTKDKQARPYVRLCTTALVAGGLALSGLGLVAGTAQAAPVPAPTYHHHWCPGDQWDPGWGPYGNWNSCRDWDDSVGPAAWQGGPPGGWQGGPPPWAAQQPPPPFWAPWASVMWNPDMNGWGFWNAGVWVPL